MLTGISAIGPRAPSDASTVWKAEQLLGIDRNVRPVYAYVGCLHPALGRIGLVVSQDWFLRDPHGVTRCDTGGLAGRMGGFHHLDEAEATEALTQLTHAPTYAWQEGLATEVEGAFGAFRKYLSGDAPRASSLSDARQRCIDAVVAAKEVLDRRLWTWEARSFSEITSDDVLAVALAPEAWKELRARFEPRLPRRIALLIGYPTAAGTHHFSEEQVVATFEGVAV